MFHVKLPPAWIANPVEDEVEMEKWKCALCLQTKFGPRKVNNPECKHIVCEPCLNKAGGENCSGEFGKCPLCSRLESSVGDLQGESERRHTAVDKSVPFFSISQDSLLTDSPISAIPVRDTESESLPTKTTTQGVIRDVGRTKGLSTKVEWDSERSIYWGIDSCSNEEFLLADWGNDRLKLFNTRTGYVDSAKVKQPLDVILLGKGIIAVSHGGKAPEMTLLAMSKGAFKGQRSVRINLYCFCMTVNRPGGYGIALAQRRDGTATLAKVKQNGEVAEMDIGNERHFLSEHGGILFHPSTMHVFTTAGKRLAWISIEKNKIEFSKTFKNEIGDAREDHELGYLACGPDGCIFVASRKCVLCVSVSGEVMHVIKTAIDPYSLVVSYVLDQPCLMVAGRSNMLQVHDLYQKTQTTYQSSVLPS